jgi:hypothetical protein
MAKTASHDARTAEACCPAPAADKKDRSGWLMALPVVGMLLCCGGPVLGAWLASAGLLAVIGSWWAGDGHWFVLALAAVLVGVATWRWTRTRWGRPRGGLGRTDP